MKHPLGWLALSVVCHFGLLASLLLWREPEQSAFPPRAEVFVAESPGKPLPTKRKIEPARRGKPTNLGALNLRPIAGSASAIPKNRVATETEGDSSYALDPAQDRQFSDYWRVYRQVDAELTYPSWLKGKESGAQVTASLTFQRENHGSFRIAIQSETSYLRVHIAKLFRNLIKSDWPQRLKGLDHSPIYFYFTFHESGRAELEISQPIHNNRLYFERGGERKPGAIQLKETKVSSNLAQSSKYIDFSLSNLFASPKEEDAYAEEGYRADPAFRFSEVILDGHINS